MAAEPGFVYIIKLESPLGSEFHSAERYMGWTTDPYHRLNHHRKGRGSAMLKAAAERGIGMELEVFIPGTRADERRFKRQHNHARLAAQWKRRMERVQ